LTLHGSDQRDVRFLVKGGEDLRLDQRVQLMFRMMNRTLAANPQCARRDLSMRTYEVMPLNDQVGLIEWMDGTAPLKSVISKQATEHQKQTKQKKHPFETAGEVFGKMYAASADYIAKLQAGPKQLSASTVTQKFTECQADHILPPDLLARGVEALSHSAESYLAMRAAFCRSLAALTVSSYVVGIGDRHLDNFMLDEATGRVIGIDFGHAFGSATYMLPVPELMGVRLTRQMTSFLAPLNSSVLLRTHMVHALGVLRSKSADLMRVMEVFVSEPLLDWEVYARKLSDEQKRSLEDGSQDSDSAGASQATAASSASYGGGDGLVAKWTRLRLEGARSKLSGGNPARITISEVEMATTKAVSMARADVSNVVLGPEDSLRRSLPSGGLSVEQQVDCLVEQATDPNILGRTYIGWAPFI